jgi:hypothetical protein
MRTAFAFILLGLVACGPVGERRPGEGLKRPPPPDFKPVPWTGSPGEELEIEQTIEPVTRMLEGEIAAVRLKIRNRSDRFILLDTISDVRTGKGLCWHNARPGRLTYNLKFDNYSHDNRPKGRTAEVFNNGMIVPGIVEEGTTHLEEQQISLKIRLVDLPREFRLTYWVLPEPLIIEKVYFPLFENPRNPPKEAESIDMFQRPTRSYLQRYVRERHVGDFQGALKRDAFVFSLGIGFESTRWSLKLKVAAKVPRRKFSLLKAYAIAGVRNVEQYTFCSRVGAWFLRPKEDTTLMVLPDRAVKVPDTDFAVLFALDAGELDRFAPKGHVEIELRNDTHVFFMRWYQGTREDILKGKTGVIQSARRSDDTYRHTLVLPEKELVTFFERAGGFKQVEIRKGPLGGFRVQLR